MRCRYALLSFIALPAFCSPLTLTILSGAEQASAGGYDFGNQQSCSALGQTQASCAVFAPDLYNPHEAVTIGQATTSWATVSAGGGGIIGFIPGYGPGRGQYLTSGWGTSSVDESLLITGGTGAGYLVMNFSKSKTGRIRMRSGDDIRARLQGDVDQTRERYRARAAEFKAATADVSSDVPGSDASLLVTQAAHKQADAIQAFCEAVRRYDGFVFCGEVPGDLMK